MIETTCCFSASTSCGVSPRTRFWLRRNSKNGMNTPWCERAAEVAILVVADEVVREAEAKIASRATRPRAHSLARLVATGLDAAHQQQGCGGRQPELLAGIEPEPAAGRADVDRHRAAVRALQRYGLHRLLTSRTVHPLSPLQTVLRFHPIVGPTGPLFPRMVRPIMRHLVSKGSRQ